MRKTVLTFGLISGVLISVLMYISFLQIDENMNFESSEIYGYLTMLVSLSFIFVGVKMLRDKHQSGKITFVRAFLAGLYISIISSVMYAVTWEVYLYNSKVDFMKIYSAGQLEKMKKEGASETEIQEKAETMKSLTEIYDNPVLRFGMTISEMLPVGILVSLITAGILRRKEILPAT